MHEKALNAGMDMGAEDNFIDMGGDSIAYPCCIASNTYKESCSSTCTNALNIPKILINAQSYTPYCIKILIQTHLRTPIVLQWASVTIGDSGT
jgi:hypothetical protein